MIAGGKSLAGAGAEEAAGAPHPPPEAGSTTCGVGAAFACSAGGAEYHSSVSAS